MKIIRNEKLIERNGKIANYVSIATIVVFAIYVYFTVKLLRSPELVPDQNPFVSLGLLVVAFILVQITGYLSPKFGRSPRFDEKIDASLKGLHSEFHLYHYLSPVSHLLIGPSGIWIILPYHQSGKAEFSNQKWKLSGGSFSQKYMRLLGLDRLGRPDMEAISGIDSVNKFLSKKGFDANTVEINALILFTSDDLELIANDSPIPTMKLKQLKEFMRQKTKDRGLGQDQLKKITSLLSPNE